ncbi:MAG: hypothetical protein H5T72_03945 [Actinobacteria bacterium]|nr:hypothetical protein [Actinomycetota bacterium]
MNCPRHPSKRAIANCQECGTWFCIECVRETDQTILCHECHRRRMDEVAMELTPREEEAEGFAARHSPAALDRDAGKITLRSSFPVPGEPGEHGKPPAGRGEFEEETLSRRPAKRGWFWKRDKRVREVREAGGRTPGKAPEKTLSGRAAAPVGGEEAEEEPDFLAMGPDEDFSELSSAAERRRLRFFPGRRRPVAKETAEGAPPGEEARRLGTTHGVEEGRGETKGPEKRKLAERPYSAESGERAALPGRERAERKPADKISAPPTPGAAAGDELLDDVVSRLLVTERGGGPEGREKGKGSEARTPSGDSVEEVLTTLLRPETEVTAGPRAARESAAPREGRAVAVADSTAAAEAAEPTIRREERRSVVREREKRWSFLAQPRSSEHTEIAASWWVAALFVLLMVLLGAVLWAVPNAYLVPRDTEYGIHAVAIGILLGLIFWWKAGRKHGTKLAVQAALTTFFALFSGEFLHWFLVITKNAALRTIFFDLVSFRFIWEHGAEVMRHTLEAMFPGAFVWIMVMPTLLAFIIGFGMPPIPEIFFQFGRAVRE